MLRLDAAIARPAVDQYGLATRAQLVRLGLTNEAIDVRIEAGVLRTTAFPGVLLHAAWPFTQETRLRAATLACGETALISHRSAGALHRFDGIRRVRPELTVCDTTKPKVRDVTVHRTDLLESADRCVVDGIPCTSRPRTLLDLGAVVPYEVVEHVVQVAIIEKLVTEVELIAVVDRVGKRGRRGTAPLRAVVRYAIPDERLQSMLEHDLHELVKKAGVAHPVLQHRIVGADGKDYVLDMAWPDRMRCIEANGHRWHATRKQMEADLARRRAVTAAGWTYDAYGWGDVHDRPLVVVEEIRRSLSP